jgi:hypothetical protein
MALRMLAYEIADDTLDDYLRMAESTTIDCMYIFCRAIVAVFGETYLLTPNAADQLRYWHKMQRDVSLGCLATSIVCTRHGRTVHLHTRACIRDTRVHAVWCLRQWLTRTCGFGMRSSAWQDHTMISMCCSALMCSRSLSKAMPLRCSLRQMATSMTRTTILQIASIQDGQYL